MKTKSIVLAVICLAQTVKSQNNFHKYYLEGQLCGGLQQNHPAAGVGGAFGFYLSQKNSIDIRAREIYNIHDNVVIGAISINYRYHFTSGFFIGGGFGHHHELAETYYEENPAQAVLGSHHNIFHRSGLAAEIGYNFKPISAKGIFSCVYPTANVVATYMTLDQGYNPLITANVGLRIGLKKL
jgi:hypothetical protein